MQDGVATSLRAACHKRGVLLVWSRFAVVAAAANYRHTRKATGTIRPPRPPAQGGFTSIREENLHRSKPKGGRPSWRRPPPRKRASEEEDGEPIFLFPSYVGQSVGGEPLRAKSGSGVSDPQSLCCWNSGGGHHFSMLLGVPRVKRQPIDALAG
ncbi:hypothetical protein MRX96_004477 [Rhipicephalus microplus]